MTKKTRKRTRRNRRTLRRIPRRLKRGGSTHKTALQIPANAHQAPQNSDNLMGYHGDPKGV